MPLYKVADVVFEANQKFDYSKRLMKNFAYFGDELPKFVADFSIEQINDFSVKDNIEPSISESLAIFRMLCEYLVDNKLGMIFHSSAICVDGKAILFAASSGVGKSTHARLWKQAFGDSVEYINDDKPIIIFKDNEFYACGTPWQGKHSLGNNIQRKLFAICFVERGEKVVASEISPIKALPLFFNQTLRFNNIECVDYLLNTIEKMLNSVKVIKLSVNLSQDAPILARKAIMEDL